MKILLVTPLFPPYNGGASVYFSLLVKELQHSIEVKEIIVLTEYCPKRSVIRKEKNVRILRLLPIRLSQHYKWYMQVLSLFLTFLVMPALLIWLQVSYGIDIYHVHYCAYSRKPFALIFRFLRTIFKTRLIIDLRDNFATIEQVRFSKPDYCIIASENIKSKYAQAVESKSTFIPVPINLEELKEIYELNNPNKDNTKDKYIIYVGAIDKNKRVVQIVEAFKIFLELYPNTQCKNLLLVGPRKLDKHSFEAITSIQGIKYMGERSHTEVLRLIKGAELLVVASSSESISRVCLEAIALRTKIIFPEHILELKRYCPLLALTDTTPLGIARKIAQALALTEDTCTYPIEVHSSKLIRKTLVNVYINVLRNRR